jgi:hypothetical protein
MLVPVTEGVLRERGTLRRVLHLQGLIQNEGQDSIPTAGGTVFIDARCIPERR